MRSEGFEESFTNHTPSEKHPYRIVCFEFDTSIGAICHPDQKLCSENNWIVWQKSV